MDNFSSKDWDFNIDFHKYEVELINGDRKIYIKVDAHNIDEAYNKALATRGRNANKWGHGECKKL